MDTPEASRAKTYLKAPEKPLPKSFRIKPTDHTVLTPEQREEITDANALLDGVDAWQAWVRVLKNPPLTVNEVIRKDPRVEVLETFSKNNQSEYAQHSLDAIRRDMATLVSLQKFDDLPEDLVQKQLLEPGIAQKLDQDKITSYLCTLFIQKISDDIDPDLQEQARSQGIDVTSKDFTAKKLIQIAKERFRNKLQQSRLFALEKAGNPPDLANPTDLTLPPDKAIEAASVVAEEFDVLNHEIGHSITTLAYTIETIRQTNTSESGTETAPEPVSTTEIELLFNDGLNSLTEEAQTLIRASLDPENTSTTEVTLDNLYVDVKKTLGSALIGTNVKINETVSPSGENATRIIWSKVMWRLLAKNIAQNTLRASKDANNPNPTLTLSFLEGTLPEILGEDLNGKDFLTPFISKLDTKYVVIFYDDNNAGIPEDIVQQGFKKGKTNWKTHQGTGIGMAFHSEYLKKLRAALIPVNRKDPEGNIIGARIAIALPIVA